MRIILLYFVDQTDRRSGHTLHRTGKAQAFLGGRLDTDGVFLKAAGYGDISAHLVDIGRKLRRLRADRAVNVMRLEAGFLEPCNTPELELLGRHTAENPLVVV